MFLYLAELQLIDCYLPSDLPSYFASFLKQDLFNGQLQYSKKIAALS